MRLLNTNTLDFEEFFDSDIPKYAILSHRWEGKEMSHQEFQDPNRSNHPGFSKIAKCCSLARERKRDWVWIDTCCIDKKSSAELTEAINSMYRWYESAEECYAYLSDVRLFGHSGRDYENTITRLQSSAWFTRGWTLQELLAPRTLTFYDKFWKPISTKQNLASVLSSITGIGFDYLTFKPPQIASVAQRMSWVSRRKTSRIEDIAYCMLGIFDVNMPLLYGEGGRAFMRLQLEIIKKSDDDSIFAWTMPASAVPPDHSLGWGLLANSPICFWDSRDIRYGPDSLVDSRPYTMTNKGLQIHFPKAAFDMKKGEVSMILDCYNNYQRVKINLRRDGRRWYRVDRTQHLFSSGIHEDPTDSDDTIAVYVFQPGI